MRTARTLIGLVAGVLGAMAGCTNEPPLTPPPPPPAASEVAPAPPPAMTTADEPKVAPPPELPPVQLVEGTASPDPDKAPAVKFKSPAANQVISVDKAGDFEVKLDVKNWETKPGASHVHLIIDGHPYKRIDDPTQPVKLKDVDPAYTLAEGQHVLVAFPSRGTHESVKPQGKSTPLAVVPFFIGKKGETKWKPKDPTLIYSRPKGANDGPPPAEGLLVDFYLANADLGDKYAVQATLKGPGAEDMKPVTIKSWKPWRIKNPRNGSYTLELSLVDKDGKPVPGFMNDTTRPFTVDMGGTDTSHAGHEGPTKLDSHPADNAAPAGSARPASSAPAGAAPPSGGM